MKIMKMIGFLIISALLATNEVGATAVERDFIRKPGHYSLDAQGSAVTITQEPAGSWTLKVTWRSGDATSSVAPEDCIRGEGWFVFVETPSRIWVFNGIDEGVLLSNSEKESGAKWFPRAALGNCPQKFWDALPQEIRAKYPKVERAGAGAPHGD
ncbi:MAG TPA: hypothetical protein VGR78_09940 [Verrucomicrobiae bacterium]|jgi:hypothetical protein|nr:hypothetical protein [Verrucomicrobiae bacterium]